MGAPVAFGFKALTAQSHGEARTDVVAKGHGAQKMRSANAKPLASRQSSRNDRTARMGLRRGVRIVGLVGVGEHAVSKRCLNRAT